MNQREIDLKAISHEFAVLEAKISNLNSINLYDTNILSEHTICEILNFVFGYQLKNVNAIKKNYPAIDLADTENRIAFQITTTKTANKIQSTLDKFIEHNLHHDFDQLFVLILGKKQKNYRLSATDELAFDPQLHIHDFQDLLKHINYFPTPRLSAFAKLLKSETGIHAPRKPNANVLLKKSLNLKKRMQKDLLRKYSRELYDIAYYEPWLKFVYSGVIIRSVEDRSFPGGDFDNPTWFKLEFWDFYDYGIELISTGRELIFDKDNNWDYLVAEDPRKTNPEYHTAHFHGFLRISFDDITTYDMEPDGYYGYPSIFCDFKHNGQPFEEIRYGRMGDHKKQKATFIFDNNKQKKLI